MKFQVEFLQGFSGLGAVYLNEMALVFEGRRPKFHVPILNTFYHRVVDETTILTVPYSRIIKVTDSRNDHNEIYQTIILFIGLIASAIPEPHNDHSARIYADYTRGLSGFASIASLVIYLVWSFIGGPYRTITYRDIGGDKNTVSLRFAKPRKENASTFTARIEEFLTVTRPFAEDKRV